MLIEPASNVSVPLTVVILTLSKVPPKAIEPDVKNEFAPFEMLVHPEALHVFPVINDKTIEPCNIFAASQFEVFIPIPNPDVKFTVATLEPTTELLPKYPDVVTEPAPI